MPFADKEKAKIYLKQWHLDNKERRNKKAKEDYHQGKKKDKLKKQTIYRAENRKKINRIGRESYKKNKNERLKRQKEYYEREGRLKKKIRNVVQMSDNYIINLITENSVLEKNDISSEFIKFYRANLLLKRTVKQLKEKENEQSKSEQSHELRGSNEPNITDCCRCYQ